MLKVLLFKASFTKICDLDCGQIIIFAVNASLFGALNEET